MKASKTLIAVAVAALIPLGAAVAGDNDQYGSKDKSMSQTSFKKLDTNKDGKISQAEAAMARLDPDDRALLALRYVAGFDSNELASAIGLSASGIRSRLERLLKRLREELDRG